MTDCKHHIVKKKTAILKEFKYECDKCDRVIGLLDETQYVEKFI